MKDSQFRYVVRRGESLGLRGLHISYALRVVFKFAVH